MTRENDRRQSGPGLKIVTARAGQLGRRLTEVGIPGVFGALQEGPSGHRLLPAFRSPIVIDTVGLDRNDLIDVLAQLDHLGRRPEDAPWLQRAPLGSIDSSALIASEQLPLRAIAIVDPTDMAAIQLVRLCSALVIVLADDTDMSILRLWIRHFDNMLPGADGHMPCAWIGLPRPQQIPSPYLLSVLPWLRTSNSLEEVARKCHLGRMTLFRSLHVVRTALNLPRGDSTRYPPPELYTLIMSALDANSITHVDAELRPNRNRKVHSTAKQSHNM